MIQLFPDQERTIHMLWDRNEPCSFAGLRVELSDSDDDITVDRDMDSGVSVDANRVQ